MAFKRLSDEDEVDAGLPEDLGDDDKLDDEDDEAEEGLESDAVIGPEDPYKDDEDKAKGEE